MALPLRILIATAAICLLAPIGFRIDGLLITLQTFVIFVLASSMGKKVALYACLIYLFLGALGLPIFGSFTGGWEKLIGNTAGFLWGFPLCAYLLGYWCYKAEKHFLNYILYFFLAHLVLIAIGFCVLKIMEPSALLFPTFQKLIPGLLLKTILGGLLGLFIYQRFPALRETHPA